MRNQVRFQLLAGVAAAALQLFIAGAAYAHHPEISAVAVCDESNTLVIEYTSTAWTPVVNPTEAKRTNPQIDILVNSVKVDQGEYSAANGFSLLGLGRGSCGDLGDRDSSCRGHLG